MNIKQTKKSTGVLSDNQAITLIDTYGPIEYCMRIPNLPITVTSVLIEPLIESDAISPKYMGMLQAIPNEIPVNIRARKSILTEFANAIIIHPAMIGITVNKIVGFLPILCEVEM